MSFAVLVGLIIALVCLAFAGAVYFKRRPAAPWIPFTDVPVQIAEAGGWNVRYHLSGKGPYIVLLHGIGANLYCWRTLVPLLNTHFTTLALDLPGFGQSGKLPGAQYGLDEQVERLRVVLHELGIKKTYLVGNSMGGNIALWFALRFPDQVLGTVVIAPATSPSLIPLSAKPWTWLAGPASLVTSRTLMKWAHQRTVSKTHLVGRDRVEETFRTYGGNREAIRSFMLATESIRDSRLAQQLSHLKSRVLILWGSRDRLVSRKVIDALESALVERESHVHLGGGHHLQEDEPEWVAGKIDAFFSRKLD